MLDFLQSVFFAREVKDNLVSGQWHLRFPLSYDLILSGLMLSASAHDSYFLLIEKSVGFSGVDR